MVERYCGLLAVGRGMCLWLLVLGTSHSQPVDRRQNAFLQEIARLKSLKRVVICLPPQSESEQLDRDAIRRALPENVDLTFIDNGEEYIEPHPWFERYLQSLRESVRTTLATESEQEEGDVEKE